MKTAPLYVILTILLLANSLAETKADESPNYSRSIILPLVSEPGKKRNLFSKYGNNGNAQWNKHFWGTSLGFDQFTGIGWGTPQAGTLITPEHVLCAAHYGVNRKGVYFHGIEGNRLKICLPEKDAENKNRSIVIQPDILVVKLATPAPEGAKIYPLPSPEDHLRRLSWGNLPKEQRPLLIATDWKSPLPPKPDDPEGKQHFRITRSAHPVLLSRSPAGGKTLHWSYGKNGDPAVHSSYHEVINSGDSSNPIFWVTKNGLVLASTFTGVTGGPDYGNPEIQKEIQAAIDKLGGQKPYKLKTSPVR